MGIFGGLLLTAAKDSHCNVLTRRAMVGEGEHGGRRWTNDVLYGLRLMDAMRAEKGYIDVEERKYRQRGNKMVSGAFAAHE